MAYEKFKHVNFRPETRQLIAVLHDVVKKYTQAGYVLTLRQLYYQTIARDLLPEDWIDEEYNRKQGLDKDTKNTIKNYKRLGDLVSDMRLCGLMDWDAIVDRGREPSAHIDFSGVRHRIESAIANYRLPRRSDQDWYLELWVEKDALASVLEPLANEAHCVLMVNKGYSSQSAMYASAQRFMAQSAPGVLLYLGDFDPSGEDMVRDVSERLYTFGASNVNVTKIALNKDQIAKYNPPPNPAKVTDSRAGVELDKKTGEVLYIKPGGYVDKHGFKSWEVDALDVDVLNAIVREAISEYTDHERYDAWVAREEYDKAEIKRACQGLIAIGDIGPFIPDPPPAPARARKKKSTTAKKGKKRA